MNKVKIRLETLTDINKFINIVTPLPGKIVVKNSTEDFIVNAKSIFVMICAMNYDDLWLESEHDIYDTGHSSVSISAAAGLAAARDIKGEKNEVIAVIGDGFNPTGKSIRGAVKIDRMHTSVFCCLAQESVHYDAVVFSIGTVSSSMVLPIKLKHKKVTKMFQQIFSWNKVFRGGKKKNK